MSDPDSDAQKPPQVRTETVAPEEVVAASSEKITPSVLPPPAPAASEIIAARKEKALIRYTGFIAQEVDSAAKAVGYDFSGVDKVTDSDRMLGLRYAEFVVPLVKAVQEQQMVIGEQRAMIMELLTRLNLIEDACE